MIKYSPLRGLGRVGVQRKSRPKNRVGRTQRETQLFRNCVAQQEQPLGCMENASVQCTEHARLWIVGRRQGSPRVAKGFVETAGMIDGSPSRGTQVCNLQVRPRPTIGAAGVSLSRHHPSRGQSWCPGTGGGVRASDSAMSLPEDLQQGDLRGCSPKDSCVDTSQENVWELVADLNGAAGLCDQVD